MIDKLFIDAFQNPIVDLDKLQELLDLDDSNGDEPGFVLEIFDIFKANTPALATVLINALLNNDQSKIAFASHKLKGSALNVGFKKLGAVCQLVEEHASTLETSQRQMLAQRMNDLVSEAIAEFPGNLKRLMAAK